jgi:hypothetical protein
MKWFKHMTDSADDEKLAALIGTHGLEGYGLWWLMVEVVAKQVPKDSTKCEVSYPLSYWLRLTGIYHHKKFKMFIKSMDDLSLISAQCSDNVCTISALSMKDVLTISMPNILKFRDEYTRKSGVSHDIVRPKKERENIDTEAETEKELKAVGQNTHVASDKPKRPAAKKKDQLSDEEWMQSLTVNPAYGHINVPSEFGKMAAWCQVKNKQPTRSRFLNWLNRIEKPIDAKVADSRYDFLLEMEGGKDGSAVSKTRP